MLRRMIAHVLATGRTGCSRHMTNINGTTEDVQFVVAQIDELRHLALASPLYSVDANRSNVYNEQKEFP